MTLKSEELRKIRKVQLKMERLATDLLAGMYRSTFKGRGMEFQEVREYQSGDDVRSIDWNVTARMGSPFIKLFTEERELTVILLVDISASTRFGSQSELKSSVLNEIGSVLAFSGIKNHDKIGLLLFSDHVEHYLPPAKGSQHVLRLIRDLMAYTGKGKGTSLDIALRFLSTVQKKQCVLFLLSDFIGISNSRNEVSVTAKTHDFIAICIHDPLEQAFPQVGLVQIQDLETDEETLLDTNSPALNAHLNLYFQTRINQTKKMVEQGGGSWIHVRTDKPYINPLRKFFLTHRKSGS